MNPDRLTEEQQLRNQVEWLKRDNARHLEDIDHLYDDLRDRFAMAALAAIIPLNSSSSNTPDVDADAAYLYADAMMEARKKLPIPPQDLKEKRMKDKEELKQAILERIKQYEDHIRSIEHEAAAYQRDVNESTRRLEIWRGAFKALMAED